LLSKNMHSVRVLLTGFALAILLVPFHTLGQVSRTGALVEGTVMDTSGAVIANATLVLMNVHTGQVRTTATGTQGGFRVSELSVGTYDVRVSHQGFAEYHHGGVTVAIGQTVRLTIELHPADVTQQLTVTEQPPALDTTRTTLTTNVDTERIEELPVQSRNYLNFVLLAPGVAASRPQQQTAAATQAPADSGFSFGGLRARSNTLSIDGLDNNDEFSGSARTELSLEIVREFQVVNNGLSAEFGGASGGAIDVVTKSGANTIHGDTFAFIQNGAFSARDPLTAGEVKPDLSRYRAGFAIGGPIRKNRTFFYTAFEQEHTRTQESSDISTAALDEINGALRTGVLPEFPRRQISSDLFPVTHAETEASGKLNHQLSDRQSLMLRYAFTNNREAGDAFNTSALNDFSSRGSSFTRDHALVGSLVSLFATNVVNDARLQLASRQVTLRTTDQSGPGVEIAGIATLGRPYGGNGFRRENHYEAGDTLSLAHGSHLLKSGVTVNHVGLNSRILDGFGGQYVFATAAGFAAGRPQSWRQVFGEPQTRFGVTSCGGFFQDTWAPPWTRRLTLTVGARYDFEQLPGRFNGDTNNFSPRLGLAFSPASDWVLRAGYGVFFDRYLLAFLDRGMQLDGSRAFEQLAFDNAAAVLWQATRGTLAGSPVSTITRSVYRPEPAMATPYSQQANFGIERLLGRNTTASATYLFVRGVKLPRTVNVNLAPPVALTSANAAALGFPAPASQQAGRLVFGPDRLNPQYDAIYQLQNRASSSYHGLSFGLNRRLSNEIAFSANYTFSKAIDDASDYDEQPQNPYDLRGERAPSANDQRHRFVFSGLFDLPFADEEDRNFGPQNNVVRILFGNIEMAPIFAVASGRPLDPLVGFDASHSGAFQLVARPLGRGRNSITTGSTANLDLRLLKFFNVKPHGKLDFVVEVFNVFNHRNVSALNPVYGAGVSPVNSFLQPMETLKPRQLQFSIDFEF
jgi:hypothetical protein